MFSVSVPVLSVKRYSTWPSSSLSELVRATAGVSDSAWYIWTSLSAVGPCAGADARGGGGEGQSPRTAGREPLASHSRARERARVTGAWARCGRTDQLGLHKLDKLKRDVE